MKQKIKFYLLNCISKFRKKIFGKYSQSVIYKTENGLLALSIDDFAIGRKLGFQGKWDMYEVNYLTNVLNNNSLNNVYVIGTHVGSLLIPLSKSINKILGFDANPDNFNYLKLNLFLNRIENAVIYNYAIGNEYGSIDFLQNKVNSGGSKIVPKIDNYSFSYDSPKKISVPMIPLDDFIIKENLPNPDFIIMDIEGAEYIALQGMQKAIGNCKFLYIEFEPNHLKYVSNCTLDNFFSLFIYNYSEVYFMRKKNTIDLKRNNSDFNKIVTEMFINNVSDDLLFKK